MDYQPGYNQQMQMPLDRGDGGFPPRPAPPLPDLFPAVPPPPRPRRGVAVALIAGAAVLVGGVITLVFALTGDSGQALPGLAVAPASATPITPEPITRADLMRRYAELAPLDRSATPATIDGLADATCSNIRKGIEVDRMITVATEMYRANATEVLRLLVSYKCPQHLGLFK